MHSKKNIIRFLGLGCCLVLLFAVHTACQGENAKTDEAEAGKALQEYTGVVQTALGKYLFVPEASGVDIAVQGDLDTESLIDREIRVRGSLVENRPYVFRADTIEVKSESGTFEKIFTRTEELDLEETFKFDTREDFEALKITSHNRPEEWEGKKLGKAYGRLEKAEGNGPIHIVVLNERDREVGRIVVENITEYAEFYVKKLRLFDTFWFYFEIKDTVDRATRARTREMFKADVLFTGLF